MVWLLLPTVFRVRNETVRLTRAAFCRPLGNSNCPCRFRVLCIVLKGGPVTIMLRRRLGRHLVVLYLAMWHFRVCRLVV